MKSLEEFVKLVADQFDETDASIFTPQTVFSDLEEWSSLVGLSLLAMVDEEFGVTLNGDDFKSSATIEDLYNRIISKL